MTETILPSWEWLERLQGTQFYRLYRSPASALAIFRKRLSGLAKSFVMAILYMPTPISVQDLESLVKTSSVKERGIALNQLHQYHIFRDVTFRSARAYSLTPDFARSLRRALVGAGDSRSFGEVISSSAGDRTSKTDLDNFSRRQWEGILGYMVGSSALGSLGEEQDVLEPPSGSVIELLKAGHLIELTGSSSRGLTPRITREGFAFVLKDVNTQIWALLFLYVENAEDIGTGMDKIEVLSFLFFVASLELGLAYSTTHLDDTQKQVLPHLCDFGIVYQPKLPNGQLADYFYPTRLATTLTSDSSTMSSTNATLGSSLSSTTTTTPSGVANGDATSNKAGFIIIETNYRVYAYTSSPLQIALLSLFINLRSRHPNLVTGKMTKQSVQRAVLAGVTADQIISYLTAHAHPQMRRHAQREQAAIRARNAGDDRLVSVLPATIMDQIHLWQLERDRMATTSGFLLKDFASQAEYEGPCRHADEIGVLVWKHDKKRMFFVNSIESVQQFIKDRRERAPGMNG